MYFTLSQFICQLAHPCYRICGSYIPPLSLGDAAEMIEHLSLRTLFSLICIVNCLNFFAISAIYDVLYLDHFFDLMKGPFHDYLYNQHVEMAKNLSGLAFNGMTTKIFSTFAASSLTSMAASQFLILVLVLVLIKTLLM